MILKSKEIQISMFDQEINVDGLRDLLNELEGRIYTSLDARDIATKGCKGLMCKKVAHVLGIKKGDFNKRPEGEIKAHLALLDKLEKRAGEIYDVDNSREASAIIQKLGGICKVAFITGVQAKYIRKWPTTMTTYGHFGTIPKRYHKAILDYARVNKLKVKEADLKVFLSEQDINRRISTKGQKTSNYLGVSKTVSGFEARIRINGVNKYLGHYDKEIDAAIARDKVAASLGRPLNGVL